MQQFVYNLNKKNFQASLFHLVSPSWWPLYTVNLYPNSNKMLHSEMGISQIVTELNSLLPQLADFINQFNSTVSQSGVKVLTDSIGNMSIDIPQEMTDDVADRIGSRIRIIDRLINTRGQEINELLQKGIHIENRLKMDNSNYVPQLTEKIQEFRRLNSLYDH